VRRFDFDAVVVGSGFGGSVTAHKLQTEGKRVCVLERGRSYEPGQFPRSPRDVATAFWAPESGSYGLFNVWKFADVEALVSSCVGGGSVIYANVLHRMDQPYLDAWPLGPHDLDVHYAAVEAMMGATPFPIADAPYDATRKAAAFAKLAEPVGAEYQIPNVAVTYAGADGANVPGALFDDGSKNMHGVRRYACRLCGECNLGCNSGSKNTLDMNYLTQFTRADGVLRTLAEVRGFAPLEGGGWRVEYVQHRPGAEPERHSVKAERLVLSAGSLGTTYLLLRNAKHLNGIDRETLGTRWCGNGDLLGFIKHADLEFDPEAGPVITSALRFHDGRYYIEDGGYPVFLDWLTELTQVGSVARRALAFGWYLLTHRRTSSISGAVARLAGTGFASSRALPLLGMGHDVPDGRLSLDEKHDWLENDWSPATSKDYYAEIEGSMKQIADALDARYVPEIFWRFRKLMTAHPVGGCPMGPPGEGFVDRYGQVHGARGLSVADGSMLPGPTGPNPSLTIAALADRSAEWILANW
jgi:cholesterol oxidase